MIKLNFKTLLLLYTFGYTSELFSMDSTIWETPKSNIIPTTTHTAEAILEDFSLLEALMENAHKEFSDKKTALPELLSKLKIVFEKPFSKIDSKEEVSLRKKQSSRDMKKKYIQILKSLKADNEDHIPIIQALSIGFLNEWSDKEFLISQYMTTPKHLILDLQEENEYLLKAILSHLLSYCNDDQDIQKLSDLLGSSGLLGSEKDLSYFYDQALTKLENGTISLNGYRSLVFNQQHGKYLSSPNHRIAFYKKLHSEACCERNYENLCNELNLQSSHIEELKILSSVFITDTNELPFIAFELFQRRSDYFETQFPYADFKNHPKFDFKEEDYETAKSIGLTTYQPILVMFSTLRGPDWNDEQKFLETTKDFLDLLANAHNEKNFSLITLTHLLNLFIDINSKLGLCQFFDFFEQEKLDGINAHEIPSLKLKQFFK